MTSLDAAAISRLLYALDAELAVRGTAADLYVVGGRLMPAAHGIHVRWGVAASAQFAKGDITPRSLPRAR